MIAESPAETYEAPEVIELGTLHDLTLACNNKDFGSGDTFTFQNQPSAIVCS